MIFTKLKMTGFKSFAEPETISIEQGMTGIVGPNGCGKSNIVEAIKWIMGESSAKSMRGGDLEDIIFGGSITRPSRNFAEVTLTLDNAQTKNKPQQFQEDDIEITRRIERGKGTNFKINRKIARAKDVQLIFADMATGARSSGIVSQGKITTIINEKPNERRSLIEEAANIKGLHQRRHEAELKLNNAETNLKRLEDILIQLDEQKNALNKQARQAARYRSVAERLRKADAHLMLAQFTAAMIQQDETEARLREEQRITAEAATNAAEKTKQRDNIAKAMPPLRHAEAEKAAELQRLKLAREALANEEDRIKKAITDTQQRHKHIKDDTIRETQLLKDAEQALDTLNAEAAQSNADDAEDRPKLDDAANILKTTKTQADIAEKNLLDAAAKSRAAEREIETTEKRIDDLNNRRKQTQENLDTLNIADLTQYADDAQNTLKDAEIKAQNTNQKLTAAAQNLDQAQNLNDQAAQHDTQKQTELTRIKAEKDALEAILAPKDAPTKPIAQTITIHNGYEQALADALGESLTAPLGKSHTQTAYWQDETHPNTLSSPISHPPGTTPLSDHLTLPDALKTALAGIGIAPDENTAQAAQKTLAPGQAITTKQGGLWRWDGFVQPIGTETSTAQRLKQQARLRTLTAELSQAQSQAQDAQKQTNQKKAQLNDAKTTHAAASQNERDAENARLAALRLAESTKTALEAAQKRHHELAETLAGLKDALAEAEVERAALADPAALMQNVEDLRIKAEACRQALAEAMSREAAIRNARDQRQNRRSAIAQESTLWKERQHGAHQRIDELNSRKAQAEAEQESLIGQPQALADKRHALGDQIDATTSEHRQATDALTAAETRLATAEAAMRDAEQNLASQREKNIRCESQCDLAKQQRDTITTRIRERLNASPDALRDLAALDPDAQVECDEESINTLITRHERLIREREKMGPVNLRAEAEIKDAEERINAIKTEQDDLKAAIAKLRDAIQHLNKEGRNRLLKSFHDVNRYFETLFQSLFNGGTAQLSLTEADDPLNAGLDILASPPGKKLQALSLLSGGEQALTALALIFAVFLTNPSPICILDEVDAPLDDANVARFCDMLSQIAEATGTRFIVVTHHRLTMARMHRLYGVTMEQKGVSRIVSVDLQTAEKFKESA